MATEITDWHLDKRVPVALILAIALQTMAGGFFIGSLSTRVSTLEEWQRANQTLERRLATLEAGQSVINKAVESVDHKVDKLVDKLIDDNSGAR